MQNIYYFILEYLLILKLHFRSLYTDIPKNWSEGVKGDVILIPGFFETWIFLKYIADDLNRSGYKIHTIPDFNYNILPLHECTKVLNEYIKNNHLKNILFISHSKGGIIAKLIIDSNIDSSHRSISVTTPYKGTIFGYLYLFNLKELTPSSKLITSVINHPVIKDTIVNLYAKLDNHILPNKNALLPDAKNIQVDVVGHTRILEDYRTLVVIRSNI